MVNPVMHTLLTPAPTPAQLSPNTNTHSAANMTTCVSVDSGDDKDPAPADGCARVSVAVRCVFTAVLFRPIMVMIMAREGTHANKKWNAPVGGLGHTERQPICIPSARRSPGLTDVSPQCLCVFVCLSYWRRRRRRPRRIKAHDRRSARTAVLDGLFKVLESGWTAGRAMPVMGEIRRHRGTLDKAVLNQRFWHAALKQLACIVTTRISFKCSAS